MSHGRRHPGVERQVEETIVMLGQIVADNRDGGRRRIKRAL